jgi:hypothetical protein
MLMTRGVIASQPRFGRGFFFFLLLLSRSSSAEDKAKSASTCPSLFDAVPFGLIPGSRLRGGHFSAPPLKKWEMDVANDW